MIIYLRDETNFETNGLGFLKDCLSANVTEVLNGEFTLELTYPISANLSEYLVKENIIKCDVGNDNFQLFRINYSEKDFKVLNVKAVHISYDLIDNQVVNTAPTNLDCEDFGNWILEHTNYQNPFVFQSSIVGVKSTRYIRRNPMECFIGDLENSMKNLFGGELERDNFTLKMLTRRGNDNHVKLIFGKNIKSIKITEDFREVATRIMPIGFDGLLLPEYYVDSPLINDYISPKIKKVEFSDVKYDLEDESAFHDLNEAYQALRDLTNALYDSGIDRPSINIKIDWLELSKTEEYKQKYAAIETVHLGDTITAEILGLDYTTRVTKTVYNPLTKMIEKYEIGSFKSDINSTINSTTNKVESINVASILTDASNKATALITSAMGGYVYKTNSEFYIMDTDNINTAQKVWRWNLNGLGYSSTGIYGPYAVAMTQDGEINADFIQTGALSTSRIEGLDSLVINLNSRIDDIHENGVSKLNNPNGYIFGDNGLLIDKQGEPVGARMDYAGHEIIDKTGNDATTQSYNGYVNSEMASKTLALSKYEGQTVSYANNFIFNEYLSSDNGRWEDVEDETYGKGIGFFIY